MSDRATLAKARRELEELYLGVPDDSVNLTFQDFAQVSQNHVSTAAGGKKKHTPPPPPPTKKMDSISELSTPKHDHFPPQHLAKLPSLDFSRALEASSTAPPHLHSPALAVPPGRNYRHHHRVEEVVQHGYSHGDHHDNYAAGSHGHHAMKSHGHGHGQHGHVMEKSMAYDDMSMMSGMSMTSMYQEKSARRRPGIPHSNICTVCSVYIYMFRNRCLVSQFSLSLSLATGLNLSSQKFKSRVPISTNIMLKQLIWLCLVSNGYIQLIQIKVYNRKKTDQTTLNWYELYLIVHNMIDSFIQQT
uniref:Uncharacterized protein n=1 Tax=Lactuca sativa TaxID=4236 RepID=A0A9R1UJ78_LACSA|nr:hypothetical protein LSAT_V11C900462040 [Lactuca sativa]